MKSVIIKTKRLSPGLGTGSLSSLSPSNPGPGCFSTHFYINCAWACKRVSFHISHVACPWEKKLTYFNHHFRPSPTSLYSESVSFEHLKEIRTLCYKITNFQRSLAGKFSTSPHPQEQLFWKNVRKVIRLISKTANYYFTYMNTMCNFLTQRRS